MSFPYCPVHKRFRHPHTRTWRPWEPEPDALAQQVGPRREAAPSEGSHHDRMPTPCDRCVAITQQVLCQHIAPR
jgi:hypothetical protein